MPKKLDIPLKGPSTLDIYNLNKNYTTCINNLKQLRQRDQTTPTERSNNAQTPAPKHQKKSHQPTLDAQYNHNPLLSPPKSTTLPQQNNLSYRNFQMHKFWSNK